MEPELQVPEEWERIFTGLFLSDSVTEPSESGLGAISPVQGILVQDLSNAEHVI